MYHNYTYLNLSIFYQTYRYYLSLYFIQKIEKAYKHYYPLVVKIKGKKCDLLDKILATTYFIEIFKSIIEFIIFIRF